MKITVLGSTGQLALALAAAARPAGTQLHFLGRDQADFLQPGRVADQIRAAGADAVINAVAYTAVDKAQSDEDTARAVNALAMADIAKACTQTGATLVHVSTDYVFDGSKSRPYVESDAVTPLGVYGRTKEEGERLVREGCAAHFILRTAWVYSAQGRNFVKTMLALGKARDAVRIVSDQHGNPTAAGDLADVILAILAGGKRDFGTYHAAGTGETSWYGLGEAIFADMERRTGRRPRCVPISTAEYPTPAQRPANSRLDCTRLNTVFGLALPRWEQSLSRVLDELNGPDTAIAEGQAIP